MILPVLNRHGSLRVRLLLILALAFALVSGLSFNRMAVERDQRIEEIGNQVQHTAENIAAEQRRIVEHANQTLINLTPVMRGLDKNPSCSALLAAKAKEYPDFWNIGLARVNDDVICHAHPFPRPLNIADRPYFQEALKRSDMVISGPVVGSVTDIPTIIFSRALRDEAGRIAGVYYVRLSLDWLQQAMARAKHPAGSRLGLVDASGRIIARYPDPEGATGKLISTSSVFRGLIEAGKGVGEDVSPLDGVRRILAVSTFADTVAGPVMFYVGMPSSKATAPIERDFVLDLSVLLGMLAIITALIWYGSNRFLLRPIADLCDAARRLGEGDFTTPPVRTDLWEVQALQHALVESAEKLRSTFAERQRFENALLASEASLRLAIEAAELGTWDLDLVTGRSTHSLRHDQIFGYPEAQPEWSLDIALAHILPEDRPKVTDAIACAEDERRMSIEVRLRQPGGAIRWVALHGRIHFDSARRPVRVVGVSADITERKQAEQTLQAAKDEAERANTAKSRFLAAASHDLRQPLSALALYVGVLKFKIGAKHAALADSIESCVTSLSELLTDLLDMSKLDAGVVKPNISDFAVAELLSRLVAQYASEAQLKGVQLRYRASDFVASSDALLVTRALGNLLANAVRYTESGGVLIGCRRHQGAMWVEIWDTGIGIPADKTVEIFEEFRQLGNEARNHGSGLGLAIVARIGALLGLEIRVRSRPGKGSMFALRLPPGQATAATHEEKAPAPHGEPIRIALVEDNTRVLEAMLCSLENVGHQVVAAVSRQQLLERLSGLAPDIVVSDYRLGGHETGFDVIAALRETFGEDLPAIIVTGDTDPKIITSMTQRGILIQYKPIEIEALQLCITQATMRGSGLADAATGFLPGLQNGN